VWFPGERWSAVPIANVATFEALVASAAPQESTALELVDRQGGRSRIITVDRPGSGAALRRLADTLNDALLALRSPKGYRA
jgi:hypothetical protein